MELTSKKIEDILEQARAITGWDSCCDSITLNDLRNDMDMIDHLLSQLTEANERGDFEFIASSSSNVKKTNCHISSERYALRVNDRIQSARKAHPVLCNSLDHALSVLMEEVGEVASEIRDKKSGYKERLIDELIDSIVVLYRLLDYVEDLIV